MDDPSLPDIQVTGNPIKMTNIPEMKCRPHAPEIGENNVEILTQWLGMDKAEIDRLKSIGVI